MKFACLMNQFRYNCDRLWKIWYSVLIIIVQIVIISIAISNYVTFKYQTFDPRFGNQWKLLPLNIQLGSIILSFSLLVFFVYSCILKVGNIANDSIELGIDVESIKNGLHEISVFKGCELLLSRLRTHVLPYNCLIHVIIALILAVPVPLMQAEQIRNEAISPDWIWRTDMDFLVNPQQTNEMLLGLTDCYEKPCKYPTKPAVILPETLNVALSLLIITIRIPTPFWYTNKAFSIVFSLFAFVTACCISFEYESIYLIIKVFNNVDDTTKRVSYFVSSYMMLSIYFSKSLLMMMMLIMVFEYGYMQYLANMRKYRQYFSDMSDSVSQQSLNNQSVKWYQVTPRLIGVLLLVFISMLSLPLLLTMIQFKVVTNDMKHDVTIVLFGVVAIVIYTITAIFLWFGLCVKSKWQFHINIQTNPLPNIGGGKLMETPEPVYGCFYNAPSVSSHTSMSKPIIRSSIEGSSDISSHRGQSYNYVFMQGGNVMPIRENMEYIPAGGSEVSYESHSKSCDSGDGRYKRYGPSLLPMDNSQYTTLASLQAAVFPLTSKAQSDTSSSENYPRNPSRRGSNRVKFKEDHDTINLKYSGPRDYYGTLQGEPVPDILSVGQNRNAQVKSKESVSPNGFDPDLEMSTDMRQGDQADAKGRDPRMCSQV